MSDTDGRVRVAIMISGAGSNMAALIEASNRADSAYAVTVVISNVPTAGGLATATVAGVDAITVDSRPFGRDRAAHEAAIQHELEQRGIEVVALAGYMRLLTPWLVGRWEGRMVNIHPSLLPLYPGLDTHARAIAAGDADAGCTVHLVTEGVDEGPILAQARVPIIAGDTPETLAQRVLAAEHALYPVALDAFCSRLKGRSA
ncbi:MAG: phosphoribosylglycinamide formyltransferase [Brevundimonas sp.]|nr:phosphoribosylglycinamide formyltransferase [Brevundimonas sp.]